MIKKQKKYYFYVIIAILSWSLMPSFSKLALNELNIFQLLFYTSFLATLTLFILLFLQEIFI